MNVIEVTECFMFGEDAVQFFWCLCINDNKIGETENTTSAADE